MTKSWRFLEWMLLGIVGLLLLADSWGNPAKTYQLLGISSSALVLPTLLVALICRLKAGVLWTVKFNRIFLILAYSIMVLAVGFVCYDFFSYPNALYSLTRIQQTQFLLMCFYVLHVVYFHQSNHWWQHNFKLVIALYPILFLGLAIVTRMLPFDVFQELVKEDNLVEMGQFAVLLFGAGAVFYLASRLQQQRTWWLKRALLVCAVGLFFVAGDEISWGQRLIGFDSTETMKQLNNQGETTIHNLHVFEWLVLYAYLTLATLGVIFGGKMLRGYFLFPLGFYLLQLLVKGGIYHHWAEVAELYLYTGVVLWLLDFSWKQGKLNQSASGAVSQKKV